MAVLTLGGNDLNNRDCQPDQLAKDILNVARSLIRVDGFQKVAICQLQYRYPPSGSRMHSAATRKYPLRPDYNRLVDQVNVELRRLTYFFPKIHLWKHRGLLLNYQASSVTMVSMSARRGNGSSSVPSAARRFS